MRLRGAHMALPASALVLMAAVSSCGTDECYDNRNALPLADLYASARGGDAPQPVALDSVSVWGIGVPRDSMLLDTARDVRQMYLPFRIDESQTAFVIRYDALRRRYPSAPDDTISFSYRQTPVFESQACGVFYRFDDVEASHTGFFIDSVVCPKGYIDNTPAANLRIYFKSQSEEEEEE